MSGKGAHGMLFPGTVLLVLAVHWMGYLTLAIAKEKLPSQPRRVDVVWTQSHGNDHEIYYRRMQNGRWGPETRLTDNPTMDLVPAMARGPNDTIWVAWASSEVDASQIQYCRFDGNAWSVPEPVPSPLLTNMSPSVAIDGQGVPWIVFSGVDGNDDDIFFSRWAADGWMVPQKVHADNDVPDILPVLSYDEERGLQVSWSHFNGNVYEVRRWALNGTQKAFSTIPEADTERFIDDTGHVQKAHSWLSDVVPSSGRAHALIETDGGIFPVSLSAEEGRRENVNADSLNSGESVSIPQSSLSATDLIIAFGDSITQGVPFVPSPGDGEAGLGGYEGHLQNYFTDIMQTVPVLNYGVDGENTASGVNRIDGILAAHDANYILILEGTNDYFWFSSDTTKYNLGVLVDKSRNQGTEPVLATLTPDELRPANIIPGSINPKIVALAGEKETLLADQYDACEPDWANLSSPPGDGLHPNDTGYQVMAQTWFDVLPKAPTLSPESTYSVKAHSATVDGSFNPNGFAGNAYFEYGPTTAYGMVSPSTAFGAETDFITVVADLVSLSPVTTYHYRLVVTNEFGSFYGQDHFFTTGRVCILPWLNLLLLSEE